MQWRNTLIKAFCNKNDFKVSWVIFKRKCMKDTIYKSVFTAIDISFIIVS